MIRTLVLIALVIFPISHIQAAPDPDFYALTLEQLLQIKVSVASKQAQPLNDSIDRLDIISRQQIDTYGYQTIDQALSSIPGFYPSNDRNYHSFGIRGFSPANGSTSRTLFLVNGERANESAFSSLALAQAFPIDIEAVERIEVSRGPGSSIWGNQGILAVVNIVTRSYAKDGYRLMLQAGNKDSRKAYLQVSQRLENNLKVFAYFSAYGNEGDQNILFENGNNADIDDFIAISSDSEAAQHAMLKLDWINLHADILYSNRDKDIPNANYETLPNEDNFTEDTMFQANFFTDLNLTKHTKLRLDLITHNYQYYGEYVYDYELANLVVNVDDYESKVLVFESSFLTTLTESVQILYGLEYINYVQLVMKNFDREPAESYIDIDSNQHVIAAYTELRLQLSQQISLAAGLRIDDYSSLQDPEYSPRLSMRYQTSDHSRYYLSYGRGFRAPSIFESEYESNTDLSNPNLQAEFVDTLELGFEVFFSTETQLSVEYFYLEGHDIITRTVIPDGRFQLGNNDNFSNQGIELRLLHQQADGQHHYLSTSFNKTEDKQGNDLYDSPKWLLNAGVSSPVLAIQWQLSLEALAVGKRLTLQDKQTDAQVTLNAGIRWGLHLKDLKTELWLKNVLDEDLFVPGSAQHYQDQIIQPRRQILANIQFQW